MTMLDRIAFVAFSLAAALGATVTAAQAWDDMKYPDLKGQWVRGYQGGSRFDPSKGIGPRQEAPLTPDIRPSTRSNLRSKPRANKASIRPFAAFRPACRASCTSIR